MKSPRMIHLAILCLLFCRPGVLFGQVSQDQVKASMLYYLCEYIEWPAENHDSTISFGLMGTRPAFNNELGLIEKSRLLKNKPIRVISVSPDQIPESIQVLVVGEQYFDRIGGILDFCRENSILMVTDALNDKLRSMINFYLNTKDQTVRFEVNRQNLLLSGINYRDDILLYGGNLIDVKELYMSLQNKLEEESDRIDKLTGEIQLKDSELISKNAEIIKLVSTINNLDLEIAQSKNILEHLSDSIRLMSSVMLMQITEMEQRSAEFKKLESDFASMNKQVREKEDMIRVKENELAKLDLDIKERERIIDQQSSNLQAKDELIRSKNRTVYLLIALGVLVTMVGLLLWRAYRQKRRLSSHLEEMVEARTFELKQSERNYREIFNGVADFIFILDEYGNILDANEPLLKAFGYTREEARSIRVGELGKNPVEDMEKRTLEILREIRSSGPQTFDWEAKRKNGESFWTIVSIASTTIGDADRFLAVVRDNDLNKKNEIELEKYRNHLEFLVKEKTEDLETVNEELVATNEELYRKNEIIREQNSELKATLENLKEAQGKLFLAEKMASLGILTAGVAHEINNPLNYIMGAYVGLDKFYREKSMERNEQTVGLLLESLKTGLDRASGIVRGLNQFSRDTVNLDENCQINSILDNCISMLNNQLSHRITLEKHYTVQELWVKGNVGNLHQVFLNIILNAIQAIEDKGTITVRTSTNKNMVMIEVEDTGCGISSEHLARITDPFFTTKEPGKGTGLGLSITYNIIQEHGGTISFESVQGAGTKVKIRLPK
ncbi:MAG: YfiR/HmsC family protein [Bacteroidota bacterium]